MEFTVFLTDKSEGELVKLIENLKQDATGYSPGIDVIKNKKATGKFRIEEHRGTVTDNIYLLRIYQGNIIIKDNSYKIENLLKANRITFKEYEKVEIEDPNAKVLNLNLEKEVLSFTP